MKLAQNQVWQLPDRYLRIVELDRLEVRYKAITNLLAGDGQHFHVSKKEFCRLIKGATLLTQAQVKEIWLSPDQPNDASKLEPPEDAPPA